MIIVAASDLHLDTDCRRAVLRQAEQADLVIIAGDLAQRREGLADFVAPFGAIAHKLVMVPGNNETQDELRSATTATVLHGESVTRGGLAIAGIGGSVPAVHPKAWDSFNLGETEAETLLAGISRADILISHSPPEGIGDEHHAVGSIGSTAVRAATERLRPRLMLCGHVHDCWGTRDMLNETQVANLGPVPVSFEL